MEEQNEIGIVHENRHRPEGRHESTAVLAAAAEDAHQQQKRLSSSEAAANSNKDHPAWEDLPAPIALQIFGLLPVPLRLRCREVCREWRRLLAASQAWVHIDLSSAAIGASVRDGSVTETRLLALLVAASRAADGQARTLDVSGAFQYLVGPVGSAVLRVVRENAASLRTVRLTDDRHRHKGLRVSCGLDDAGSGPFLSIVDLLTAAPNLTALEVHVSCLTTPDLEAVLGTSSDAEIKALFAPVRVFDLDVWVGDGEDPAGEAAYRSVFLAAAPAHPWLRRVRVDSIEDEAPPRPARALPGLLSPFIQGVGAMAGRLEVIDIDELPFLPEWLPVLTHALRSGVLREFHARGSVISEDYVPPEIPPGTLAQFCDALRESRIERLSLDATLDEWEDATSFEWVLRALMGHQTLSGLKLRFNHIRLLSVDEARHAVVSALAGLLAADSPALASLDIRHGNLGPDELAPVFRALASNTNLRKLKCGDHEPFRPADPGITEAFAREFILPAVRACASLRALKWNGAQCGAAEAEVTKILEGRAAVVGDGCSQKQLLCQQAL